MHSGRFIRAVAGAIVCGLAVSAPVGAGSFCDVVFKDVALEAPIVVLARVEKPRGARPALHVAEVLKDESADGFVRVPLRVLAGREVRDGDHVLLALDEHNRPLLEAGGLGMCDAISVLPIRGGKLRSRERISYDSQDGTLRLEDLREQLRRELAPQSRHAAVNGG